MIFAVHTIVRIQIRRIIVKLCFRQHWPHFIRAPSPLFYPFISPNNGNVINWLISSGIPIILQFQYPVRSFVLFNFFVVCSACDHFTQNDWYPIESMYKRKLCVLSIYLIVRKEWCGDPCALAVVLLDRAITKMKLKCFNGWKIQLVALWIE